MTVDSDPRLTLAAAPARAYREVLYRPDGRLARWVGEHFEVLARPGEPLTVATRPGDVLLGVTLGSRARGRCDVLDAPLRPARPRQLPPGRLLLRPRSLPDPGQDLPSGDVADGDPADGDLADADPGHVVNARRVWCRLGLPSGVTILDMGDVPSREVRGGGFQAWTNSASNVYVDASADVTGVLEAVMHHEACHIRQFRRFGGRPPSYAHMMRYECVAYGESATWTKTHRDSAVRATHADLDRTRRLFCDEIGAAGRAGLSRAALERRYRGFLLRHQMLPPHTRLSDLYRPDPKPARPTVCSTAGGLVAPTGEADDAVQGGAWSASDTWSARDWSATGADADAEWAAPSTVLLDSENDPYEQLVAEISRELRLPFSGPDDPGLHRRRARLRSLFGRVPADRRRELRQRLGSERTGDELSRLFHGRLHRATRRELLRILEAPAPAPVAPPTPPRPAFVSPYDPLPASEQARLADAVRGLRQKIDASGDSRTWRYRCWLAKLAAGADDRVIPWYRICPRTSGAIGAAYLVGPCDITAGSAVDQTELQRAIRSVPDVEPANRRLSFITHLRPQILWLTELTSDQFHLENFRRFHDQVQMAITKLDLWANNPMGGSSAMPPAYVSIKDWIGQRQRDPNSLYSCL